MVDWIIGLVTLTLMEIVLGIDNIIFIAIVAGKLPARQQPWARNVGLILGLAARLLLLFSIALILSAKGTLFTLPEWTQVVFHEEASRHISIKDLILMAGGLFLIGKSTYEIHHKLEGEEHSTGSPTGTSTMGWVLAQIVMLDVVFAFDSIFTAVGMVQNIPVIVVAMIITVIVMFAVAGPVSNFVSRHPSLKILALSFLILIGILLVAEGFEQHLDKGYIYFAMVFSFVVEMLNMRLRGKKAVQLKDDQIPPLPAEAK